MNNQKSCYCKGYASQRAAAPRIWECPKHGKTGFAVTKAIIKTIAEVYEVTYEEAWIWANALLKWKRVEYKKEDEIYYCEKYFNEDLVQEFGLRDTWWERLKDNLSKLAELSILPN